MSATESARVGTSQTKDTQRARRTRTHIGPWQLGRTLGRGSSGRVRLAKHADTGQLAAVKIVPKAMVESTYGIEREVIIMKLIEHPNIMALYDVWENKGELYLVLEYIEGGELFDYLVRRGRLNEREAVYYFRQICCGVQYCHQFNICHRDLKPENLLLDRHRNIKIADFGMAALETAGRMLETSCGSPHYASPEIVAGRTYHGAPSDIWSCGVILFALVTGHLPFDDDNIRVLLRKVQAGRFSIPSFVGPEARDLISRMLRVDPSERISMVDIFRHPLLNKHHHKHNLPMPIPTVDATHPVSSVEEIDPEILRNLKTLWHHTAERDIVRRLLDPAPNPEKTFYCLLQKYREAHRKPQPRGMSSPRAGVRGMSRSGSRASVRSKRAQRSGSSRSLRTVPRQSRVSMASIHSRYVAERPAPAPPRDASVASRLARAQKVTEDSEPASAASTDGRKPIRTSPVKATVAAREREMRDASSPVKRNVGEAPSAHNREPLQARENGEAPNTRDAVTAPEAHDSRTTRLPQNSFAELIDAAFAQRTASGTQKPQSSTIDERRTVSDGDLLPMIFEEKPQEREVDRRVRRKPVGATPNAGGSAAVHGAASASASEAASGATTGSTTHKGTAITLSNPSSANSSVESLTPAASSTPVKRKSVASGASSATQTSSASSRPSSHVPGPTQAPHNPNAYSSSAKTGPVLRPVSMLNDNNYSQLSVDKRQSSKTAPAGTPATHVPIRDTALDRKPTKRIAEFASPNLSPGAFSGPASGVSGYASGTGTSSASGRKPLGEASANVYPPLVTEQKQKVSLLRRFTPKRNNNKMATVTSNDYKSTQLPPNKSNNAAAGEETIQNWFLRVLNLGSGSPKKTLLSTADVNQLRAVIVQVLTEWSQYGLSFEGSGGMVTATINSKNAFKLRMSRFTIRTSPLRAGSTAICTQVRGAQVSFLRFTGELERVLGNKNLLGAPDL